LRSAGTALPISAVDIRLVDRFNVGGCIGRAEAAWHLVYDQGMIETTDEVVPYYAAITEEQYQKNRENVARILGSCGYPETVAEYQSLWKCNKVVRISDAKSLRPVQVDGREQFWLTVHIPKDTEAGHYAATVWVVPDNAPATKLTLNVWVPDIDLLEPRETYSVYNPTFTLKDTSNQGFREQYFPVSDEEMVLELRNMVAHGCTNPDIYAGVNRLPDGSLSYDVINHRLDLREEAGVPKGELYISDGAVITTRELKPGEYQQNIETIKEIQAWATGRGYGTVYFTGADEVGGQRLLDEYEAFKSVEEAGSGVWVATPASFHELVGDVLEIPVVAFPGMTAMNNTVEHELLTSDVLANPKKYLHCNLEHAIGRDWQSIITKAHDQDFRFFHYLDGWYFPGEFRRTRGFGLWIANIDGTMIWSYAGIKAHGRVREAGEDVGNRNLVLRVKGGVLDTLCWEAYREGYDDSRYIATLLAAGGEEWLQTQPQERIISGNLDELRQDVAREILRLQAK